MVGKDAAAATSSANLGARCAIGARRRALGRAEEGGGTMIGGDTDNAAARNDGRGQKGCAGFLSRECTGPACTHEEGVRARRLAWMFIVPAAVASI